MMLCKIAQLLYVDLLLIFQKFDCDVIEMSLSFYPHDSLHKQHISMKRGLNTLACILTAHNHKPSKLFHESNERNTAYWYPLISQDFAVRTLP